MKPRKLYPDKLSAGENNPVSQPLSLTEQLLKENTETNFSNYSGSVMQQIVKKSALSLREAFNCPKQLLLMVAQGPYYVRTPCILHSSPRAHSFTTWIHWMSGVRKRTGTCPDSAICALSPHQSENAFKINYFERTFSPFKFYFKTSQ